MRRIEKGTEPLSFADWKALANENWSPTYVDLRGEPKNDLHLSLMTEQGFICCYCECRIGKADSDIEHIKPWRKFPVHQLDYNNLLASCLAGGRNAREHCNGKKGDWYDPDMVSPLQTDCASYFVFTRDGQILATDDPNRRHAAEETIRRLNLNCDRLVARREEALDGVFFKLSQIDDDPFSEAEDEVFTGGQLREKALRYARFDRDGQLEPYCSSVLDVIRQKLALVQE